METILSPRLKNITCACLAGLLAAGALYCKVFLTRERTAAVIGDLLKKNSAGIETFMTSMVRSNLLRSDLLLKRFRAGQLTDGDLDKKEALIGEKNGVIDFYYGEIYFFRSLPLAAGDWRLIRKNQDLYFYRRLDSRICYLHYFMDMKSSLVQHAWKYPSSVFDLKYSPAPLAHNAAGLSYDQVRNSFYYSHILDAVHRQLVVNLVFSAADFSSYFKKRNSQLFYGIVFLLFLVIFLAFPKRLLFQLPALAGMTSAAWFFIAWLGKANMYFPNFLPALQSVWQLLDRKSVV
jgi:hypothetical protein